MMAESLLTPSGITLSSFKGNSASGKKEEAFKLYIHTQTMIQNILLQ